MTLPPTDPHVHITVLEGHFGIMHSAKLKVSGNKLFYLNVTIIIAFLVYFLGTNAKYCSVLFGLNCFTFICLLNAQYRASLKHITDHLVHCTVFLYEIHRKTLYGNSRHNAKQSIHFVALYRHHLAARENFIWFRRTRNANIPAYKHCPS